MADNLDIVNAWQAGWRAGRDSSPDGPDRLPVRWKADPDAVAAYWVGHECGEARMVSLYLKSLELTP